MNRPIKFRVWDTNKQEFHYYEFFKGDGGWFGDCILDYPEHYEGYVQQLTGLTDKNGKEIWEGDLVDLGEQWEPREYEVVFNRGGFCLKFGDDAAYYPDVKYAEQGEVIGNVYENPELLSV